MQLVADGKLHNICFLARLYQVGGIIGTTFVPLYLISFLFLTEKYESGCALLHLLESSWYINAY